MKFSLKCKKQWFDLFISPHAALRSYLQQNKIIKIIYARIFEPIQGFELRPLVDAHVPFNGGLRTRPTEPESQKQKVSRGVGAHNFCTHTNKRAQEKRSRVCVSPACFGWEADISKRTFRIFSLCSLETFVSKRFGLVGRWRWHNFTCLNPVSWVFLSLISSKWRVSKSDWHTRCPGAEAHRTQEGREPRTPAALPGWCACWTACCWDIWPGICGYRTHRGSTATAGWTLMEIITRASSVRRTLIPWMPRCAAAPARCATAARLRTHGWTRAAAPTTGRWTTLSLQRVSLVFF